MTAAAMTMAMMSHLLMTRLAAVVKMTLRQLTSSSSQRLQLAGAKLLAAAAGEAQQQHQRQRMAQNG
jgi:hypothetical protein